MNTIDKNGQPTDFAPIGALVPGGGKNRRKDKNFLEMADMKNPSQSIVEGKRFKDRSVGRRNVSNSSINEGKRPIDNAFGARAVRKKNSNILNNSRFDALSKIRSSYQSIGGSEMDDDEEDEESDEEDDIQKEIDQMVS